jgi:hypothetical protein
VEVKITQSVATASQYSRADDAFAHANCINEGSTDFYAVLKWVEDETGEYFVIRVFDYLVDRYIGLAR